jgi:FtsP/CotA-like multicopper oxidase with cupredoxin domain
MTFRYPQGYLIPGGPRYGQRSRPDGAAKYGTANGVPQLDVATLRPFLKSGLIPPDPEEAGLKETVKARTRAGYGRACQVLAARHRAQRRRHAHQAAKYVHQCHIVEQEDNDMMERMIVVP